MLPASILHCRRLTAAVLGASGTRGKPKDTEEETQTVATEPFTESHRIRK